MPRLLVSSGTSDDSDHAYLNALAGIIGLMNEARESRIVSRHAEKTPNGIVVTLEVEVYDENELADTESSPPDKRVETDAALIARRARQTAMHISEILYLQSERDIEQGWRALEEQAAEEMAHPAAYAPSAPLVEQDFDAAAHVSDAAYVHSHTDNTNHDEWPTRITTELLVEEIEDSVRHDVLSAGIVAGTESEPHPAPPPELLKKKEKRPGPLIDDPELAA